MHKSIAKTQYQIRPEDLALVLALARAGTLAQAGERLALDASTVFRNLQRIERGLGRSLFERSRSGYVPLELAQQLMAHAEQLESAVEAARATVDSAPAQVSGTVRITTTDTILHGLVAPALLSLHERHPLLDFDLHTGNELASLSRRDADIAVRATKRPPSHVVGKSLGAIRVAVFAAKQGGPRTWAPVESGQVDWIAPDDALPEHPSVAWRKRHLPKAHARYKVASIQSVMELIGAGLGVGILPLFLAQGRRDLRQLTDVLPEAETTLWLLTHPEVRHLRRVAAVYAHLSEAVVLP